MQKVKQDQLNIKIEIQLATICWIFFSFIYFFSNLGLEAITNSTGTMILRWLIFFGIIARNVGTFFAITLFTVYSVKSKDQIDYGGDQRINNKLNVLNLNIIMTHNLPFSYFKDFIQTTAP